MLQIKWTVSLLSPPLFHSCHAYSHRHSLDLMAERERRRRAARVSHQLQSERAWEQFICVCERGGGGRLSPLSEAPPPFQRGCCCNVCARCGTFLMFVEILPSEAHRKTLWQVSPNACGWSPEAFG